MEPQVEGRPKQLSLARNQSQSWEDNSYYFILKTYPNKGSLISQRQFAFFHNKLNWNDWIEQSNKTFSATTELHR